MSVDFAFIDSGVGGIPYLAHLKQMCPAAKCVYFADNKNFPYGTKSHQEILDCVTELTRKIISEYNPGAIVIACNTISVNSLDWLRKTFPDTPIIGTVPAIKLAASITRNKKIGLLATQATINNPYTQNLKNEFASDCQFVLRGDTQLIDFIEKHSFTATRQECIEASMPAVHFFKEQGCDTVILACTHFLNIAEEIQEAAGNEIKVVDSVDGVTRRALDVHKVEPSSENPQTVLVTTGTNFKEEYDEVCRKYDMKYL
ncbi:MAG: glutamate racemase [Treponema sp.]|nr:glutamate racemase [Treponema sp.]